MKLLTFRSGDRTYAGLVYHGEQVVLLEELFSRQFRQPYRILDVGDLLRQDGMKRLQEIDLALVAEDRQMVLPLRDVEIVAPILRPPKIVCVGLNYRDHAEEQNRPLPKSPMLFAKAANIVVGHEAKVMPARTSSATPCSTTSRPATSRRRTGSSSGARASTLSRRWGRCLSRVTSSIPRSSIFACTSTASCGRRATRGT
jgi:hypothetical protein